MLKAGARLKLTPRSLLSWAGAVSGKLGQRTDNAAASRIYPNTVGVKPKIRV